MESYKYISQYLILPLFSNPIYFDAYIFGRFGLAVSNNLKLYCINH